MCNTSKDRQSPARCSFCTTLCIRLCMYRVTQFIAHSLSTTQCIIYAHRGGVATVHFVNLEHGSSSDSAAAPTLLSLTDSLLWTASDVWQCTGHSLHVLGTTLQGHVHAVALIQSLLRHTKYSQCPNLCQTFMFKDRIRRQNFVFPFSVSTVQCSRLNLGWERHEWV